MTVDRLCERFDLSLRKPFFRSYFYGQVEVEEERLCLAKPVTFMNRSGEVIVDVLARARLSVMSLVVVCDNLDLPAGVCRLKRSGGSAGHHGLESIIAHLGDSSFYCLYIGIGRPADRDVIAHVLGDPSVGERTLYTAAIERAAQGILTLLTRSPSEAMNELNQRISPTRPHS